MVMGIGIAIIIAILMIIAKTMVEKRIGIAKRYTIGIDSPAVVKELRDVAKMILLSEESSVPEKFNQLEGSGVSYEIVENDQQLKKVIVRSAKTIVICSAGSSEPFIYNIGVSKGEAILMVFLDLMGTFGCATIMLFVISVILIGKT